MEVDSKPEALDALDRDILQKQIEAEALKKEDDKASKDRLEKREEELAELDEQSAVLTAQWKREQSTLADSTKVKEQLDQLRIQAERAQREGRYEEAGRLLYNDIPSLEAKLKEADLV